MKHKKKENCDCISCKYGQEAADKMQKEAIDKFGWVGFFNYEYLYIKIKL